MTFLFLAHPLLPSFVLNKSFIMYHLNSDSTITIIIILLQFPQPGSQLQATYYVGTPCLLATEIANISDNTQYHRFFPHSAVLQIRSSPSNNKAAGFHSLPKEAGNDGMRASPS